ncbi:HAD hydrolase-like protein [Streptomyces sp. 184]|uniref:HAD hydrolase-like protein n=1 Tax=Streptomyces sp. 184 TaxID=1827526 RepID=UPI0038923C74
MTSPPVRTRTDACAEPLCTAYDTALLDLDGVVYIGGAAVEHAAGALACARARGMRLAYVTNNASRPADVVAGRLTAMGVHAEPADVVTSGQAVARLVAEAVPPGARVLVVGGKGLYGPLRERGLRIVESADDDPAAVVQGHGGPEMTWGRLSEAAFAVQRGVPWFASNADLTIPTPRGIAPGNGAALAVVRLATGAEPRVAGKPEPPMHRETIIRTGARRPLVVGDRLDTDIEGAYNGGVDALLVLTGVTGAAELLAALPRHRPAYVAADLRGLSAAQPEVAVAGGGEGGGCVARCGGWSASVRGTEPELRLDGEGQPLDGLRALCAAAWTYAGEGSCGLDPGKALARLGL